jgi:hypothetical protein
MNDIDAGNEHGDCHKSEKVGIEHVGLLVFHKIEYT